MLTQMAGSCEDSPIVPPGWVEQEEPGTGLPYWVHRASRTVVTDASEFERKPQAEATVQTPVSRKRRSKNNGPTKKKARRATSAGNVELVSPSVTSVPRQIIVDAATDDEEDEELVDLQDSPVEGSKFIVMEVEDGDDDDNESAIESVEEVATEDLPMTGHFGTTPGSEDTVSSSSDDEEDGSQTLVGDESD